MLGFCRLFGRSFGRLQGLLICPIGRSHKQVRINSGRGVDEDYALVPDFNVPKPAVVLPANFLLAAEIRLAESPAGYDIKPVKEIRGVGRGVPVDYPDNQYLGAGGFFEDDRPISAPAGSLAAGGIRLPG